MGDAIARARLYDELGKEVRWLLREAKRDLTKSLGIVETLERAGLGPWAEHELNAYLFWLAGDPDVLGFIDKAEALQEEVERFERDPNKDSKALGVASRILALRMEFDAHHVVYLPHIDEWLPIVPASPRPEVKPVLGPERGPASPIESATKMGLRSAPAHAAHAWQSVWNPVGAQWKRAEAFLQPHRQLLSAGWRSQQRQTTPTQRVRLWGRQE
jgi:hypothetical protein